MHHFFIAFICTWIEFVAGVTRHKLCRSHLSSYLQEIGTRFHSLFKRAIIHCTNGMPTIHNWLSQKKAKWAGNVWVLYLKGSNGQTLRSNVFLFLQSTNTISRNITEFQCKTLLSKRRGRQELLLLLLLPAFHYRVWWNLTLNRFYAIQLEHFVGAHLRVSWSASCRNVRLFKMRSGFFLPLYFYCGKMVSWQRCRSFLGFILLTNWDKRCIWALRTGTWAFVNEIP